MTLTDVFIKRPVLALVVSSLVVLLGLQAGYKLPVRQFPFIEESQITVTSIYPGADARTVQGFVTTPLQQKIAKAEGIEYLTSESLPGTSVITVHVRLGFNAREALSEVIAKVNEARGELPNAVEDPVITSGTPGGAIMYLSFQSDKHSIEQLSDYLVRSVQPELATIEGMAEAEVIGEKNFAMRIWLDPARMAAAGVTANDIHEALRRDHYVSAGGPLKGPKVSTSIRVETDLKQPEEFGEIRVRQAGDKQVLLKDVATLELAREHNDTYVTANGKESLFIGVTPAPGSNPLTVADNVRDSLPILRQKMPEGIQVSMAYDATEYIREAIFKVMQTLLEAVLIVVLVVFLFLGSFRVVIIPVIAIPLSLVGVLFFLYIAGFSVNLLTLLALVLAIGLVVDDAIVMVENIHRYIEEGHSPYQASLLGARQVAWPVVSMTLTLAAVYAPIGFLGGLTGALFTEFAFTLAGAVMVSGIVALTLSPVMCSWVLQQEKQQGYFASRLDRFFIALRLKYQRVLSVCVRNRGPLVMASVIIMASVPYLVSITKRELAPSEDGGMIFVAASKPRYANLEYLNQYTDRYIDIFQTFKEFDRSWQYNTENFSIGGMGLVSWSQRTRSEADIQQALQAKLAGIGGLEVFSFSSSPLPGIASGLPVQFVVASTSDYQEVHRVAEQLVQAAWGSGLFMFVKSTLAFDRPEVVVSIDRKKAADLGISMEAIGNTLSIMLGESEANRFSLEGRAYKVIPQAHKQYRTHKNWLERYYVRTRSGDLVALSTVVTLAHQVEPNVLAQYQQLNSATIEGMLSPGVSLGAALAFLSEKADEITPPGFRSGYKGESRQYIQEGNSLWTLFGVSLMIIFLVLAAQFNSFRDPLVILLSVPLSIFGAVIFLATGFGTLNIYTQVGLVTLIGLISKHGILIVEFANQLNRQGLSSVEAVCEAASLRLRPILMTTAATILGVLPLLYAFGAGANSRYSIGLVITAGMLVGTVFTLFIVPVFYTLLSGKQGLSDKYGQKASEVLV